MDSTQSLFRLKVVSSNGKFSGSDSDPALSVRGESLRWEDNPVRPWFMLAKIWQPVKKASDILCFVKKNTFSTLSDPCLNLI